MTDNYYKILGVDQNADQAQIKQAYRRLAAKNHPDRGGNTADFQKIQSAYDVLSNPEKKQQYDNPQTHQAFHQGNSGFPPGFEEIFAQFGGFGNPFGFNFRYQQAQPKNKHINLQHTITLEEAFSGNNLIANITLPSGRNQTIDITIPRGIQDGMVLRLNGIGDDTYPNLPKGDIHLTINVKPHEKFTRQGDDLTMPLGINAIDAIVGKTYKIFTIDNQTVEIALPAGIQHGQKIAIEGRGMPNINDNRVLGKLILNVEIQIPTNLTPAQQLQLKQIFN
jgi:curved DNA-binding protein